MYMGFSEGRRVFTPLDDKPLAEAYYRSGHSSRYAIREAIAEIGVRDLVTARFTTTSQITTRYA